MKRKIFFRADAAAHIGYGHFVRSLALADMLKDDFDCTFFTMSPTRYQQEEVAKVCKLVSLPSDDSRFDIFLGMISGDEIVVLDNYYFSTEYQQLIKQKGCKLVCIDDIHDKHYLADVVINHTPLDASYFSVEPYTKLCLGLDWALLRRPFLDPVDLSKKEAGHWFIAFGGSDYYNLTEKFAKLISEKEGVNRVSVVVGDAYKYCDSLSINKNVDIYKNLSATEMATLMQRSEYAILPTSGICIEALAMGCKIFGGYYVDNQIDTYNVFAEQNLINPIGDLRQVTEFSELYSKTHNDCDSSFPLVKLRYRLLFRTLNDNLSYNGLRFINYTSLSLEEHRKIWEARNHLDIRKQMDIIDFIEWDNHCSFVNSLLNNNKKQYWGVYNGDVLIGSVNITFIDDNRVERGIFIVPDKLGMSWGSKVESATNLLLKGIGVKYVEAKVLKTNDVSLSFHYKNGYGEIDRDERYYYLIKEIKDV